MSAAGSVGILHLTDPHLFADEAGELRGVTTSPSLKSVLAHYRAGDWLADLVVATGDIVQDDSVAAYEKFRSMLSGLDLPVYSVPGNHDVRERMRKVLAEPPFHYCETLETGGWMIAGLDSCVSGQVGGAVSAAELDRLDAEIESRAAGHVLVCLHHPPVAVGSRWLDLVGMEDGDEVLGRLAASGRVRLVLFGHVHQEHDSERGGMRILGTPSTCRQFAKDSDEYAVDDNPPAYRRIELHADGSFDQQLVWVR
jgi:Icc protein